MLTRDKVLDTIRQLPDKFSVEEVIDRIILLEKIETGLLESEEGKVTSDDELNSLIF